MARRWSAAGNRPNRNLQQMIQVSFDPFAQHEAVVSWELARVIATPQSHACIQLSAGRNSYARNHRPESSRLLPALDGRGVTVCPLHVAGSGTGIAIGSVGLRSRLRPCSLAPCLDGNPGKAEADVVVPVVRRV